ncbi:MAG: hydrogenase iron-sulfur subunit [Candidatus Thermoplasmatota archaeon]|nr:hydrogenase iron-sulfur subunit [Candidatus Thermoplasmatota archaeon]
MVMAQQFEPLILVLSNTPASDPGIDFAGSRHIHYPAMTAILRIPCSAMIRPDVILYALTHGFDGVCAAGDGPECPYLGADCVTRTAKRISEAQNLLKEKGIDPGRLRMSGVCSVCGEAFAKCVRNFSNDLKKLGPQPKPDKPKSGAGADR